MKDSSHTSSFVSGVAAEPVSNDSRKRMGDHEKHTVEQIKKDHNHKKHHMSRNQAKKELLEKKKNQPTIMYSILLYSWMIVFMTAVIYWIIKLFGPEK